jgi:uncharacterized protein (DUF2141 family)
MKLLVGLLCNILLCALSVIGFAQGTINGTLYANDVKGFLMIGCLLNLVTQDCDYDKSPSVTIEQSGNAAPFQFENAPAGQYLIIAWKDTNNNGTLEEDQDEVGYYVSADGQPGIVTPPIQNVDIRLANVATTQPLGASQDSVSQDLVGSWSNYGYLGNYLNGNVTAKLDFLDSSKAQSFIFNADGTFSSFGYNLMYDDYLDRYIACLWTKVEGTYTLQGDRLIMQIQKEEFAQCGNEFAPVDALTRTTATFVWRFEQTENGTGLGLLDISEWSKELGKDIGELSNIDEESNWISGYAYHLVRDK